MKKMLNLAKSINDDEFVESINEEIISNDQ